MSKVYVGTVGLVIVIDLGESMVGATAEFHVRKPGGETAVWDTIVVNDTALEYTTVEDDLDVPGRYFIQPVIALDDWSGPAETVEMDVYAEYK